MEMLVSRNTTQTRSLELLLQSVLPTCHSADMCLYSLPSSNIIIIIFSFEVSFRKCFLLVAKAYRCFQAGFVFPQIPSS